LWKSVADFRSEFSTSKGLSLSDTARLIAIAPDLLSGELLSGFSSGYTGQQPRQPAGGFSLVHTKIRLRECQ
jgi:hypothetical protein